MGCKGWQITGDSHLLLIHPQQTSQIHFCLIKIKVTQKSFKHSAPKIRRVKTGLPSRCQPEPFTIRSEKPRCRMEKRYIIQDCPAELSSPAPRSPHHMSGVPSTPLTWKTAQTHPIVVLLYIPGAVPLPIAPLGQLTSTSTSGIKATGRR